MQFERSFTKAPWEKKIGYCRAIKTSHQVFVTGTAPVCEDGQIFGPGEPYLQAKKCLEIIEKSLSELDLDLTCITRTRMFVTDISFWEEFGKAHAEFFADHPPTTSMIEVKSLIDPLMLIEIEADGVVTQ